LNIFNDDEFSDDENMQNFESELGHIFESHNLGMSEEQVNIELMNLAFEISKTSFLWKFLPLNVKFGLISKTYDFLSKFVFSEGTTNNAII